eukprot:2163707-Amphidinium_carterae.2
MQHEASVVSSLPWRNLHPQMSRFKFAGHCATSDAHVTRSAHTNPCNHELLLHTETLDAQTGSGFSQLSTGGAAEGMKSELVGGVRVHTFAV